MIVSGRPPSHIGTQFSALLAAQVVASVALIALNVIVASGLGPGGFGAYALFVSLASAGTIPFSWVTSAVIVFGQENDRYATAATAGAVSVLAALCAAVVAPIALGVDGLLGSTFPHVRPYLADMVVFVLAAIILAVVQAVLQITHRTGAFALVVVAGALAPLFAISLLFLRDGPSVGAAVSGLVVGQLLAGAIPALLLVRRMPRPRILPARLIVMGRFVGAYLAGSVQGYVLGHADVVLASLFIGPTALGRYSLASRIYKQLLIFAQVLSTVALPYVNSWRVRGMDAAVTRYFDIRVPQLLVLITFGTMLSAAVGSMLITVMFGREYEGTESIAIILAAAFVLATWRRLASPLLTAYQLLWGANLAALLSAFAFSAALIVLAPQFGGEGAAAAIVIGTAVDLAVAVRVIHARVGGQTRWRHIALVAVGMGLVLVLLAGQASPIPTLALATIAAVSYTLVARGLRAFGAADDAELFVRVAPRPFRGALRLFCGLFAAPGTHS